MGSPRRNVVRVAHAYGNSRDGLERALQADVDMIEADMWYRGGNLHIHHEHHLGRIPILIDRRMTSHKPGRFAVPIGNYVIRPRIGTLSLDGLLKAVAGRKRLLLDVKGHYKAADLEAYVQTLVGLIRKNDAESWVAVCGQTYSVLHRLREVAPEMEIRYSIEQPYQWERFQTLMRDGVGRTCMSYRALDDTRLSVMIERGVDFYFWTVDDQATADRLVESGAHGIISNDLSVLSGLPRVKSVTSGLDEPLTP